MELVLAENPRRRGRRNPYENPEMLYLDNPRRKRRGRRNPAPFQNPRRSLGNLMSAQGIQKALDLEATAGLAGGLVVFQKGSEAFGQTGFMDAALTIALGAVAGSFFEGNRLLASVAKGGVVLGLLKVATLIPGLQDFVSAGSMVIGGRNRGLAVVPSSNEPIPMGGTRSKITFLG